MEGTSIVSRARTAFHSAAAKAERVLIDFKLDLLPPTTDDSDFDQQLENKSYNRATVIEFTEDRELNQGSKDSRHFRWRRPQNVGTKQEWQERFKSIGRGKKGTEESEKVEAPKMFFPVSEASIYLSCERYDAESKDSEVGLWTLGSAASSKDIIPPSSVLKQLAVALESSKNKGSIKDFLASSRGSSPAREKAGLSLAVVKSLMRLEKEEKLTPDLSDDQVLSFIHTILDADGLTPSRKMVSFMETSPTSTLPRDIHGSPPESFVAKLSEIMGSLRTMQKMALFWCRFVYELRRLWLEQQYVPGIPTDERPDLRCCLLYQQLQVMNCCVSRKRRREIGAESLDSLLREAGYDPNVSVAPRDRDSCSSSGSLLYAKIATGEFVLRLGADHPADNLAMLETGEPIYAPLTQEAPLLTEDYIREHEEFVLRTGSVGAGCLQLLSDMQAFKAANPGCVLEDFVRWHSPPDWKGDDSSGKAVETSSEGSSGGRLSSRMRKEGNLWRELWETAKPVPAVRQVPLFDEDLSVEGILTGLEDISPSRLFEQLFLSLIGLGFAIAEPKMSTDEILSKLFYECKDYVVATCQADLWTEKLDDLCQVYETVEVMLVRPEDAIKMMKQPDQESPSNNDSKPMFQKLNLISGVKGRLMRKSGSKEKSLDEIESPAARQAFSNFFDSKSSLFSKKPPKHESSSTTHTAGGFYES